MRTEINTFEDFLLYLGKVKNEDATWENVVLNPESVIVSVKTEGPNEDSRVDARSATLIKKVQDRADQLFQKYSSSGEKAPFIKVASKKGSNLLDFDLTHVMESAIHKMTSGEVTVIASLLGVGALGVGAFWIWTRYREHISDNAVMEKALEINQNMARDALGNYVRVSSPIRDYLKSIDDSALISVAGSEVLPKEQAKKALAVTRLRLPVFIIGCDGIFELLGIGVEKMPPTLKLSQNDICITASIKNLDMDVQNFLVEKVKSCLAEGTLPQSIELQMDVSFTERELRHAIVVGVGAPRPGKDKYKLSDIPSNVDLGYAIEV